MKEPKVKEGRWAKIGVVITALALLIAIYQVFIEPRINPPYVEKVVTVAENLTSLKTIEYPDSMTSNSEVRHIVNFQDKAKEYATEFKVTVQNRSLLSKEKNRQKQEAMLNQDTDNVRRRAQLIIKSLEALKIVEKDLKRSSSKWANIIQENDIDDTTEKFRKMFAYQDSILKRTASFQANDNQEDALKVYDSLYKNEDYLVFHENMFNWYIKLYKQLNSRITEIKNDGLQ